jgi:hypothetical protein
VCVCVCVCVCVRERLCQFTAILDVNNKRDWACRTRGVAEPSMEFGNECAISNPQQVPRLPGLRAPRKAQGKKVINSNSEKWHAGSVAVMDDECIVFSSRADAH